MYLDASRINRIQSIMYRKWKYGMCKIEILWNKVTKPVSRIVKSYKMYLKKSGYIKILSILDNFV